MGTPASGVWQRFAGALQTYLPGTRRALAGVAAAAGNPSAQRQLDFEDQMALRQQDAVGRQALLRSQLTSADLSRQLQQKELENYQTPAQREQTELDRAGKLAQIQRQYAEPQDIVGAVEGQPGQLGHFQRQWNHTTQQYELKPTMVSRESVVSSPDSPRVPYDPTKTVTRIDRSQLMAAPKSAGAALVEPDRNSSTGYSHVWRDAMGNEVGRAQNAIPPAAFVPKQTTSQTTKVIQTPDGYATVPVTNSSTSGPTLPWQTNASQGGGRASGAGNAKPLTDASGNQVQPQITAATRSMKEAAPHVLDFINRIEPLVRANAGNMGPLSGRWSDFFANKVGAPDPSYNALRVDDGLLSTLLMRMHTGSRGAVQMQEHFRDLLGLAHQSPENYLAALDEIRAYANDLLKSPGQSNGAPPAGAKVIQLNDFLNQR